jgi:hypothetical protein
MPAPKNKVEAFDDNMQPYNVTAETRGLEKHDRGGFGQLFGLHPSMAGLVFILDTMLFAGDVASAGAFLPVSIAVAVILGFLTWRAQIKFYGDDSESAAIKAAIVALLTAIPVPLPAVLAVPTGIIGLVHTLKGGKRD